MSWDQFWKSIQSFVPGQSSPLAWKEIRHQKVTIGRSEHDLHLETIGNLDGTLIFDEGMPSLRADDVRSMLQKYQHSETQSDALVPQLAALVYDITGYQRALSHYFPLLKSQSSPVNEVEEFFQALDDLLHHPNLSIRVWDIGQRDDSSVPPSLKAIIAGHILETLFYRRDILKSFLQETRFINIYMNKTVYQKGGGVAGGCYDPNSGSIKLVASRVYEGFYGPIPGGSAFLHEFGHMLDAFDPSTGRVKSCRGLLPGLSPKDGDLFTSEARRAFLEGKRIERERYERCRRDPAHMDEIPIGHPYVFQNDREFIAGYLEMFFRNPHYFAALNPTLYNGFSLLFGQDPRLFWETDMMYYVRQNRAVYLKPDRKLPPVGLTMIGA